MFVSQSFPSPGISLFNKHGRTHPLRRSDPSVEIHAQGGRVHFDVVFAVSGGIRLRVVNRRHRYSIVSIVIGKVALRMTMIRFHHGEHASVGPEIAHGNTVIGVAVHTTEVEHEQDITLLEGQHLISFIAQSHVFVGAHLQR